MLPAGSRLPCLLSRSSLYLFWTFNDDTVKNLSQTFKLFKSRGGTRVKDIITLPKRKYQTCRCNYFAMVRLVGKNNTGI